MISAVHQPRFGAQERELVLRAAALRLKRACLMPVEWAGWRRFARWLGVKP